MGRRVTHRKRQPSDYPPVPGPTGPHQRADCHRRLGRRCACGSRSVLLDPVRECTGTIQCAHSRCWDPRRVRGSGHLRRLPPGDLGFFPEDRYGPFLSAVATGSSGWHCRTGRTVPSRTLKSLLLACPAGRSTLPATFPEERAGKNREYLGEGNSLHHGIGQPRPDVPEPVSVWKACSTAVGLVLGGRRPMGYESGIRPAEPRRVPAGDYVRLHVLPQRVSSSRGREGPSWPAPSVPLYAARRHRLPALPWAGIGPCGGSFQRRRARRRGHLLDREPLPPLSRAPEGGLFPVPPRNDQPPPCRTSSIATGGGTSRSGPANHSPITQSTLTMPPGRAGTRSSRSTILPIGSCSRVVSSNPRERSLAPPAMTRMSLRARGMRRAATTQRAGHAIRLSSPDWSPTERTFRSPSAPLATCRGAGPTTWSTP